MTDPRPSKFAKDFAFPVLFDGAYGTYYAAKTQNPADQVDQALLGDPACIEAIHLEYLQAGASAIKTCTFSVPGLYTQNPDLTAHLIHQAVQTANAAIEKSGRSDVLLFADLGPVSKQENSRLVYESLARLFLDEGVTNFLFETLPDFRGIEDISQTIRDLCPVSRIAISFAAGPDGLSPNGCSARMLLEKADQAPAIDWIGLNCLCGPSHMLRLLQDLPDYSKPMLVMPNAGYPFVTSRRTIYSGTPDYFARTMQAMQEEGARILGGCCGTTPDHIAALKAVLDADCALQKTDSPAKSPEDSRGSVQPHRHPDRLDLNLRNGRKSILVELDPPANDHIVPFLEDTVRLKQAGIDMLTIADNPIGRPRADSSLLACKIHRETGLDVLPHMTCRDRNLNAIKALLLGLSMEDVHQVLLVTGDPLPRESRDEVKAVFSFNSRTLASYVQTLEDEGLCQPFHKLAALDLNARNFDVQLGIAKEKEAAGIEGFLTQPIFSRRAIENLQTARAQLHGTIYAGLMPIVSHRNALFLKNEITGMDIPDELAALYENKDREECEAISLRVCQDLARQAAKFCDGFYLMTPFRRVSLILSLIEALEPLLTE